MNFKCRLPSAEGEKRLRERLEKEYEQKLKESMRQYELQMRSAYKLR